MRLLFLRIISALLVLLLLCGCTETENEPSDDYAQGSDVIYNGGTVRHSGNDIDGSVVNKRLAGTNMPAAGKDDSAAGSKSGAHTAAGSSTSGSDSKSGAHIAEGSSTSSAGSKSETHTTAGSGTPAVDGKSGMQTAAGKNASAKGNKGTQTAKHKKNGTYVAKNVHLGDLNVGGLSEKQLAARLKKVAAKKYISPKNALFDKKTWTVTKERVGRRLDTEYLMKAILSAGPGERIKYKYISIYPEVTRDKFANIREISKFSTRLIDKSSSRVYNIKRAGKSINNSIIMPNREFSFNRATGRRTLLNGYKKATIILKTPKGLKHVKGPAGGVCQLSSTMYNAALRAKLQITERHEHSDEVPYVEDGMDATVMYGGADLKFINNRDHPIMIKVSVDKKNVTVRFLENTDL